jgi:hypothetical protein
MRKTILCLAVVAIAVGLVFAQEAAEIDKQIEGHIQAGWASYKAGRPQDAIQHLQQAIGLIQKQSQKDLTTFLPKPGKGWKADEPDVDSGNWGSGGQSFQFNVITQTYTREADGREVEVVLTNSPQMVMGQKQAAEVFKNPQMRAMLQKDPNQKYELIEEGKWFGLLHVEKGESARIIAFIGKLMVTISTDADDEKLVREFWASLDRAGLEAASK